MFTRERWIKCGGKKRAPGRTRCPGGIVETLHGFASEASKLMDGWPDGLMDLWNDGWVNK